MTEADIQKALMQFFHDQFKIDVSSPSEDLIEAGILDSLMLIEVVMFMETEFSVTTKLDDLEMENFLTIESMARFVVARQSSADPVGGPAALGEPAAASAGKGGV